MNARFFILAFFTFTSIILPQEKPELRIPFWPSGIADITFANNGEIFLAYGRDQMALLCDSKTGKILRSLTVSKSSNGFQLGCFIGITNKILLAEYSNQVTVIDPVSGNIEVQIPLQPGPSVDRSSINRDGTRLVSHDDSVITVYDLASGQELNRIPVYAPETRAICRAWFDKDDKAVMVLGETGELLTFDPGSGKKLKTTLLAPNIEFEMNGKISGFQITPAAGGDAIFEHDKSSGSVTVWKSSNGRILWQKKVYTGEWVNNELVLNGRRDLVALSSAKDIIDIIEVSTGRVVSQIKTGKQSIPVEFSPDSKTMAVLLGGVDADTLIRTETTLWSVSTAKQLPFTAEDGGGMPLFTRFNPVRNELIEYTHSGVGSYSTAGERKYFVPRVSFLGNSVVTKEKFLAVSDGVVKARELLSGRIESQRSFAGRPVRIPRSNLEIESVHSHLQISEDLRTIVTNSISEIIALDNNLMQTGNLDDVPGLFIWMLGFYDEVGYHDKTLPLSNDAKYIGMYESDSSVTFYDLTSSGIIGKYSYPIASSRIFFGPEKSEITLFLLPDEYQEAPLNRIVKLRIHDGKVTGPLQEPYTLEGKIESVSRDARYTLIARDDGYQVIENNGFSKILEVRSPALPCINFDRSGDHLGLITEAGQLKVFEISSGTTVCDFNLSQNEITDPDCDFEYSPLSRQLVCVDNTKRKYYLFDTKNGGLQMELAYQGHYLFDSPEKDLFISEDRGRYIFYRRSTGKELFTLFEFGEDWAVTHPSGLFDATPGAMEKMYYVQGLDIIEFEQLKDKYWEPGLYEKVIKGERLRDVEVINSKLELWPEVKELLFRENYTKLQISLENRGGGIGKVQVFLNGKEIINDARGKDVKPDEKSAHITIGLKDHPLLVNGENLVEVLTWNAGGTLSGKRESAEFLVEKETYLPGVYIVSIGVSDYEGSKIDLKYAAKDAADFLSATSLAARNLFTEARTHTYLLNTEKDNPLQPTKSEITRTFREIGKNAKAEDVVIVYLSGHGLNIGGENGDLHYLTRDAFSPNPEIYSDPAVKDKCTISGSEMIELLKGIPATKQVLIIDACSSGKLVDNLVEKRDIESSIVKALDRMKERAGLHIITGSAADAVSYEASRYGQGLLTYSLLAGMKGLALKDNRTVDVSLLMQHAREMVPKLAQGIGGIQEPMIFSPKGSESFDIGLILEKDKQLIPLAKEKEIFVNSVFQEVNEFSDLLSIGELIDQKLEEISSDGKGAPLVFWGVNSFPAAYRISGNYSIEGNRIEVRFKILKDKTGNKTVTVTGDKNALDALVEKIIKIALEGI